MTYERDSSKPKTGVRVRLTESDGNAFMVLGKVAGALRKAGHKDLAQEYTREAMEGDYDHLLRVSMQYVEVT